FPRADRSLGPEDVLGAFIAQFYDDKPCPRCVFLSHDVTDRALIAEALSVKSGRRIEVLVPQRGEKKDLVEHALANAREALGRKLTETSSQQRLLGALAQTFGLPSPPRRIEIYDNSHIQGTNAVGAMIVAGPEGFRKNQYRKFNIRSSDLTPGAPRAPPEAESAPPSIGGFAEAPAAGLDEPAHDVEDESPWPSLVLID